MHPIAARGRSPLGHAILAQFSRYTILYYTSQLKADFSTSSSSISCCRVRRFLPPVSACRWLLHVMSPSRRYVEVRPLLTLWLRRTRFWISRCCAVCCRRARSASCPVGDICTASGTENQKPAFCPDVGKGRVSSQVVILSTTAPAARSVRRCRKSTPWQPKVNFSGPIHTPRNSSPQPKPAVIPIPGSHGERPQAPCVPASSSS